MRELQDTAAPSARRLLRVLLLRFGEVPAGPGREVLLRLGRHGTRNRLLKFKFRAKAVNVAGVTHRGEDRRADAISPY